MTNSPRKIGIVVSGANPWEIVFCILHIERSKFMRAPVKFALNGISPDAISVEQDLSRQTHIPIEEVKATGVEGIIIPGGKRLFNNLCNFETAGDALKVDDNLKNLLKGIYRLEKPIGAFGESVFLVTKALQGITRSGLVVTVGNDPKLQAGIEMSGAQAVVTRPGEVVLDETNKIVTSGGELATKRVGEVYSSCENLLSGLIGLIEGRD